jgi:hypothetical protein
METSQLTGFLSSQIYQSVLLPRRGKLFGSNVPQGRSMPDLPVITRKEVPVFLNVPQCPQTGNSSPNSLFTLRPSAYKNMDPSSKNESRAKQYLASQKEKWTAYQKSIHQGITVNN